MRAYLELYACVRVVRASVHSTWLPGVGLGRGDDGWWQGDELELVYTRELENYREGSYACAGSSEVSRSTLSTHGASPAALPLPAPSPLALSPLSPLCSAAAVSHRMNARSACSRRPASPRPLSYKENRVSAHALRLRGPAQALRAYTPRKFRIRHGPRTAPRATQQLRRGVVVAVVCRLGRHRGRMVQRHRAQQQRGGAAQHANCEQHHARRALQHHPLFSRPPRVTRFNTPRCEYHR